MAEDSSLKNNISLLEVVKTLGLIDVWKQGGVGDGTTYFYSEGKSRYDAYFFTPSLLDPFKGIKVTPMIFSDHKIV